MKEKIIKRETGFDPIPAQQELLKQLLHTRFSLTENVKKIKDDVLKKDAEMRSKNIPYQERQIDFSRLIKCEQWIDYLNRTNFSHMLINEWAVEFHDDLGRAREEANYYFEYYVL